MSRLVLAAAVLLGSVAAAQPVTYFVPIASRSAPALAGTGAVDVALWYSDPGTPVGDSLVFGTSASVPVPFTLQSGAAATVLNFPGGAAGIASTPDVLVQGTRRSLVAVANAGEVRLAIIDGFQWVELTTSQPISGAPPLALAAAPDGGAILLVSDATATRLTRFDLGLAGAPVQVVQGLTASPVTEPLRALVLDGARDKVLAGGNTLGNLYILPAALDGGPDPFDLALVSQGRLSAPVTGVAVYQATGAAYLLVTSAAGLTVYDLLQLDPLPGAFRVIAQDQAGPLSAPTGVAVTNLDAGSNFPAGVIALGDATNRGIAFVRWDAIPPDAGLVIDPITDPRGLPAMAAVVPTEGATAAAAGLAAILPSRGMFPRHPRSPSPRVPRAAPAPPVGRGSWPGWWLCWRSWPCAAANAADRLASAEGVRGSWLIQGTMLYKVTPALVPPARRPRTADGTRPKKRRASAVFDADGHEVLITLMCLKCRQIRPLAQFGLRKMPDGAIRNQPWCRSCRGAATPKKRPGGPEPTDAEPRSDVTGPTMPSATDTAPAQLVSLSGGDGES